MANAGVRPSGRKLRRPLAEHYRSGKPGGHRAGSAQIEIGIGECAWVYVQGQRRQTSALAKLDRWVYVQGQRRQTSALAKLDRTGVCVGRCVRNQGLRGSRAKYAQVPDGSQARTGGDY